MRWIDSIAEFCFLHAGFFLHQAGIFFIIGLLHMHRIQNLIQTTPVVKIYVWGIAYAGIALYIYKELVQPILRRKHPYVGRVK